MSIASSQVDLPAAFKIYRQFKDKDYWDGDIFLDKKTTHDLEIDDLAPPPYVVVVQGPPNVGKSLLIKSLVKHFTMEHHPNGIRGPITLLTGDQDKKTRLHFVECPDGINAMIDAAKYADLVLLLVDASYGFEAETFEFLNLLHAHSVPQVMCVLTHLDELKDETERDETKKRLESHFWSEIYQGAIVSCLSGLDRDMYKMCEVEELAEHILTLQLRLSSWRAAHPYVLVDCSKDVTPLEKMDKDANCDRDISLYGYLRGCNIKSGTKVHIAGVGDFRLANVTRSADPFPLSSKMEEENDLVEPTHMENVSFRTGTYLRLEVHDVPFRWVQNLDPCHPILVGGISPEEENVGHMQARLKRHNWHMKLLKPADPVTVSAGWRRYQTKPIYTWEMDNGRHQILHFSHEHGHCHAMFYGPLAPPGTRIAVVQSNKDMFRIVAKAVVLDPKDQSKIMKEIKQKGVPHKIVKRRTALIKFEDKHQSKKIKESKLKEILHKVLKRKSAPKRSEYEGSIRTQSGILWEVIKVRVPCFFDPLSAALEPCDSTVPFLRLERRRRVEITDVEPSSYPCSSRFMLLLSPYNVKETVVVMSEEKRAELVRRQQLEENEKAEKEFFSGGGRELMYLDS